MFLSLHLPRRLPRFSAIALLAAFGAGVVLGAAVAPGSAERTVAVEPLPASQAIRTGYPVDVLRIFDGDTFEARVRIWPGHDVTTKVRLRSVDAPEMKARCEAEWNKANAAKDLLMRLLAEGGVSISRVGLDKYGGRVDADVATARTRDVGEALLAAGLVRSYSGGRRDSWCDASR